MTATTWSATAVVELDQRAVTLEDRPVVPVATEPGCGLLVAGLSPLEHREAVTDVVEDAVEHHPHPSCVGRLDEGGQVVVVPQAWVHPEVVAGVIAVGLGVEDRAELEHVGPEVDEVVQPADESREPVPRLLAGGAGRLGADETQRIDVPDHGVPSVDPHALDHAPSA
jgi:hypothetical protein